MNSSDVLTRRSFLITGSGVLAAALAACGPNAPAAPDGAVVDAAVQPIYDLDGGIVTLANGVNMPINGLGTYALSVEEAAESVYWAIEAGARLIDTAAAYNNEEGVGRGIAQALADGVCTREELFVTTKLWQDGYSQRGVDGALSRLGLDYVDLLFVHQAMGDYRTGYETVIANYDSGKTRSVGLSNFTDEQFAQVVADTSFIPQVAQYETHLHLQRHAAQGFLAQYGVQLEGWFPLGGKGNTATFLSDPVVTGIAQGLGKSPAQVIERWHLQEGHVIMPGSHNRDHIRENVALFDFVLTDLEGISLAQGIRPGLYRRALHMASRWDGEVDVLAAAEVPVRLSIGESDDYYGSAPAMTAAQDLREAYRARGLNEERIDELVVLDVKPASYFRDGGAADQHGGGAALFPHDNDVMGWLFQ